MTEASFILTLIPARRCLALSLPSLPIADLGGNITETNQHWDRPATAFPARRLRRP